MQNKIDRSRPPISNKKLDAVFPPFEKHTLSNGIRVYIYRDQSQPLVSAKAIIRNGSAAEPVPGLARITSQLLLKGTRQRTASEIARESDLIGASMNAASTWDYTTIGFVSLSDYLRNAFEIFEDCLLESKFAKDETERLKTKQISDIRQKTVNPRYLAKMGFNAIHYPDHPYGHPSSGTVDSVESITAGDCREFFNNILHNSKITFIVGGNCDTDDIMERLERRFGGLVPGESLKPIESGGLINNGLVTVDKKDAEQAALCIGRSTIDRHDPDYSALRLLNTIFGGYFMSRVNHRLREEKGFTYGAGSQLDSRLMDSALLTTASVGKKHTREAIEDILELMDEISKNPIPEDEISRARQYMLGAFVRGMETPQQISTQLQALEVYDLETDYLEKFIRELNSFTPDSLMPAQLRLFAKEPLIISAAGDSEYLGGQLKAFGNVTLASSGGEIIRESI
ncbi:MAG: M16 family metallopeptidase [Candidatus Kapaibacterium sp.]